MSNYKQLEISRCFSGLYKKLIVIAVVASTMGILMSFDASAWGTVPSTEAEYENIGEVLCIDARQGAVDYSSVVHYYDTSGTVVGYQRYVNTFFAEQGQVHSQLDLNNPDYMHIAGGCDAILDSLQKAPSPIERWNRGIEYGMAVFIINPNGGANYFLDNPPTISVSPTVCELSWNPQLNGAIKSCDIEVNGAGAFPMSYRSIDTSGSHTVEQIDENHFRITAIDNDIFNKEEIFRVAFWLLGTPGPDAPFKGETGALKVVEVKRVDRYDGEGGDPGGEPWEANLTYYSSCGFLSGPRDYCITLTGEGLERDDGSHYSVTPSVETNDTGLVHRWADESSFKYYVKVSNIDLSYARIKFCINDEDGNPTDNCRTVDIGSESNLSTEVKGPGGAILQNCETAATEFSWIICPFLEKAIGATEGAFGVIEDFLKVDPKIFSTESEVDADGDGTQDTTVSALAYGWGVFRDLANIVLIILFIIIIISQLTGVGIDNYGVKRMLPRLIVIAILINLSFIITQLVVDISNVVGGNAYAFLKSLASGFMLDGADTAGGVLLTTLLMGIIAVLVVAILNPVVLLSMVIAILGALISVVFMFMLLGVRQAAVAIFVMISPLAFVANILPNTATLFKKWWNIFKTLLVLYPICGIVLGGAYFGSALLMSIGEVGTENTSSANTKNAVIALVSLIVLVAPIFFIPKLVKGTFEGLGKIGGAIAGLGGRFSGAVKGGIRKSEVYGRAGEKLANVKDMRTVNRMQRKIDRGGTLRKGQQARLARAQTGVLKREQERAMERLAAKPGYLEAQRLAIADVEEEKNAKAQATLYERENATKALTGAQSMDTDLRNAIASGDKDRIQAVASTMKSKYGKKGMKAVSTAMLDMAQNYKGTDNERKSVAAMKSLMQRDKDFDMQMSKDRDLQDFINESGAHAGVGVDAKNLNEYTADAVKAMDKDTDWENASGGFVARAAVRGGADFEARARSLAASNVPAIRNGIMSNEETAGIINAMAGNAEVAGTAQAFNMANPSLIDSSGNVDADAVRTEAARANTRRTQEADYQAAMNQMAEQYAQEDEAELRISREYDQAMAAQAAQAAQQQTLDIRHDETMNAARGVVPNIDPSTGLPNADAGQFYLPAGSTWTPSGGTRFTNDSGQVFDRSTGKFV